MYCNSCGSALPDQARFCGQCGARVGIVAPSDARNTLALLATDLEHPSMQRMNQALRESLVLRKSAESLSKKIGKPWYESTFNAILATERRYPRVFHVGRLAAARLGVKESPSVYVELDHAYQSATYGSERDAFINVGSFLPRLLTDRELLFVLGHELGHLLCQHALWTTASMFLVGQQRSNLMAEGVMGYLSNPLKIIEGGVDSMVANWMRVADFTADRAALLAVGSFDLAKRTIFLLHVKARRELDDVDIDEWVAQAEAQDQTMSKLSQMMTSATPYLGQRLIELKKFAASPQYDALRARVDAGAPPIDTLFDANGYLKEIGPPRSTLAPETIRRPAGPRGPKQAAAVRMLKGACPHCRTPFAIRLVALPDKPWVEIRCKQCGRAFRLDLRAIAPQAHAGE